MGPKRKAQHDLRRHAAKSAKRAASTTDGGGGADGGGSGGAGGDGRVTATIAIEETQEKLPPELCSIVAGYWAPESKQFQLVRTDAQRRGVPVPGESCLGVPVQLTCPHGTECSNNLNVPCSQRQPL